MFSMDIVILGEAIKCFIQIWIFKNNKCFSNFNFKNVSVYSLGISLQLLLVGLSLKLTG